MDNLFSATRLSRALSGLNIVPFRRFSLRTMFGILTAVGIGMFTYLHFQTETWKSGLHDSEIQSAKVSELDFDDHGESHQLSKGDSIRFVRMAEKCPLRGCDECPTSYLPQPGPLITIIELTLSENRTLSVALIGNCLQTTECLVDISSKREEMLAILWQPN